MSRVDIVHLETYRRRRQARYRRSLALHAMDQERKTVLELLWKALSLSGADRAAAVWLDEYGPGLVHPHVVLDLGADLPRRTFSARLLRRAWKTRVPDLLDLPQADLLGVQGPEHTASVCILALGSDGPRSWFLFLDSPTPHPGLSEEMRDALMFLAGEVASVVLHRDLLAAGKGRVRSADRSFPRERRSNAFSGWPVLQDLEEEGQGPDMEERIRSRFLVARLVRGLVDDNLVMEAGSLAKQVEGVRREIGAGSWPHLEGEAWDGVLRAVAGQGPRSLAGEILGWGRIVEEEGHRNGALELLGLAFEAARAEGSLDIGVDAARFLGKAYRTRADWEQAMAWYEAARVMAEEHGGEKLAVVLDGMANAYRDRGNLPKARALLGEVLALGKAGSDPYAVAIAHHDLMTVEKLGGNLKRAIQHGWEAAGSYPSDEGRLKALFDLAGVLRERGELVAAEDAYTVVVHQARGFEHRILSMDALALIAALQGDLPRFRRISRAMEEEGWRGLEPVYKGQVLFFKGMASRALGLEDKARVWLEEALAYAEEHGLNKLVFDAEEALKGGVSADGHETRPEREESSGRDSLSAVRQGLRELRESLAQVE